MAVDYSTIWIKWHKIEEHEAGGTLRGYRVHIEKADHHDNSQPFYRKITVGPGIVEFNITNLPAWTNFRVWVAAFTDVGEGIQRHEEWIRTSKTWSISILSLRVLV